MTLPPLPLHAIEVVEDRGPHEGERGFMNLRRLRLVAVFEGGERSEPFAYDAADRSRLDAVVVVAHFRGPSGERRVLLRSALRPPVALRPAEACPIPEPAWLGNMWEVPAGLVEEDERTPEGLRACAARELFEETGARADASAIQPLGPATFPSAGVIGERHFYFHVEIAAGARETPSEDGSALERGAVIVDVTLDEALDACRRGLIEDAKTEIALRRLAELAPPPGADDPDPDRWGQSPIRSTS
jgi:ADP-ribose pyrophosphatase